MPAHAHSEIHLHVTWHTKNSEPTLSSELRTQVYVFLKRRALLQQGVQVHAIGGTADHVHLAVTIPPTLEIGRWIGELKGASSYYANGELLNRRGALEWQTGYGVVSFATADLPRIVEYIENQEGVHKRREAKRSAKSYQGPLARNRP